MKNLHQSYLILILALVISPTYGQIQVPKPSPHAKIEQTVGLTELTIEYSRPSIRGRKIFDGLVPYGVLWRTGANANTIVSFSDNVTFGETPIKSGSYALYTIPNEDKWAVILYKKTDNWGIPKEFKDDNIVAKENIIPSNLNSKEELFTIEISNLENAGCSLDILWEHTKISIPIKVQTDERVVSSIEKTMKKANVSLSDYYSAANYYLQTHKDIRQAKQWIDKAIEISSKDPKFWMLRVQSLIYAANNDKKQAIKIAKKSLKLAQKEGNQHYIKMNQKSIDEWK